MSSREEILIQEIIEISRQYREEVNSKRGAAWPKAIKGRVEELARTGMGAKKIAAATGLPHSTIYTWGPKLTGKFKEVKALPAIKPNPIVKSEDSTLIVVTPKGLRIEGISFEQFLACLEKLK